MAPRRFAGRGDVASLGSQVSAAVGGGMRATALAAAALLCAGMLSTLVAARQGRR
ncbi:hypothetical protein [Saccharomonospora xinjiangensis]|uniref:hypothetical protein n=1 Tax=Saccharomonospora xinjiangensis TaxID=75294 RepID=UPI0002FA2ABF|nr:hypothetical protein [Saccharomonospora xinjiangensis]